MNRASTLVAVGVALLTGCNAPAACETRENGGFAPSVSATPLVTTTTLQRSGETLSGRVRATLGNLPELWQDHSNIVGGSISLSLSLAYQTTPFGGDGIAEMPRLSGQLGLADTQSNVDLATTQFQAGSVGASLEAFHVCQADGERDCCKFGERECSVPVLFSVRRQDGTPFPPVDVTITVDAEAEVTRCPIDDHQAASLRLEAESP
jgi:hypothetical protein